MHSLALKDRKGEFKVGRIHPRFSYFGLLGMMGGNIFWRSILQKIHSFFERFVLREICSLRDSSRGSLWDSLRDCLRDPLRDSSFAIVVELMMEEVQVRFFKRIFFFYFHGMNVRERAGAYKWEYILLQKIFHPIVDGWHAGCLTNFIHTNKVAELKEGGFAHHATYQALHSDTNLA